MSKTQVTMHAEYMRDAHPAINVKVRGLDIDAGDVMRQFMCDETVAERALEHAWEAQCEMFWLDVPGEVERMLPAGAKVYSEGRSGGWLAVHNLPDVERWDAVMLSKWRKVQKFVEQAVRYYTSKQAFLDVIEANGWANVGGNARLERVSIDA